MAVLKNQKIKKRGKVVSFPHDFESGIKPENVSKRYVKKKIAGKKGNFKKGKNRGMAIRGFLSSRSIFAVSFTLICALLIVLISVLAVDLGAGIPGKIVLPEDIDIEMMLSSPDEYESGGTERIMEVPEPRILSSVNAAEYRIKKGDILSRIARKYNLSLSTIISFNKISDVRRIRIGSTIQIPDMDGLIYEIRNKDTLSGIAGSFDVSKNDIIDANNLESSVIIPGSKLFIPGAKMSSFDIKKALGELFIFPAYGRITDRFGPRKDPFTGKKSFHYGLDIANYTGTTIKAAMAGKIIKVDYSYLYGKYIVISHKGDYQTLYAHLNKVIVRKGDWVYQGQKIGEMGNTGRSTGTHLHFSLYKNKGRKALDPQRYLK